MRVRQAGDPKRAIALFDELLAAYKRTPKPRSPQHPGHPLRATP
ncbi:hypothetical protein AB0G98_16805 [Streptomyces sp. NPDC020196]